MLETIDYFLYAMPALILSAWAQIRVARSDRSACGVPAASGLSGAEAAELILRAGGVSGVVVEPTEGELSDHYDPRGRVLRLSGAVYRGHSLTATAIAAHEAGHAIQQSDHYPGLAVRNLVVPVANLGSQLFGMLLIAGFALGMSRLVLAGLGLFSALVFLQVLNLPVEFDASRRARLLLCSSGMVQPDEEAVVSDLLHATAWTYVAAALCGVFSLAYPFPRRRVT